MTQPENHVGPVVKEARDDRGHRRSSIWLAVGGLCVLVVAGLFFWAFARTTGLQSRVDSLSSQVSDANTAASKNNAVAQTLSLQVKQLGGTPKAEPTPVPGTPGRGIVGTTLIAGHLIVAYTDNTTADVGQVKGADGPPGRGITGSVVAGGHLVISYSEGPPLDAGQVVGKDGAKGDTGRGVRSMDGTTGRLIITYSDNSTEDAGPLPPGPQGPKGDTGAKGRGIASVAFDFNSCKATVSYDDNTTQQAPMTGCQPKTTTTTPPLLPVPHR